MDLNYSTFFELRLCISHARPPSAGHPVDLAFGHMGFTDDTRRSSPTPQVHDRGSPPGAGDHEEEGHAQTVPVPHRRSVQE